MSRADPTVFGDPMAPPRPARLPAALALLAPLGALAHPGHGLDAPLHWHASDAWGYALLAAIVLAGLWLGRRK